ncbi:MAG: hypothetical protein PUB67_06955 [Clostridiales bacterium]|nr:hypothetical protein [Clostridiales bacterium]
MKEKSISEFKYLLFAIVFIAAMLLCSSKAFAEPGDYENGNYNGIVKSADGTGAKMYTAPGSKNPRTTKADGTEITVIDGTAVIISGEQKDPDTDMWYECTVTLDGTEYKGFLYSGRVERGSIIEATPTPTITSEPTPTPDAEVTTEPTSDPGFTNPDSETDETTKQLIKDSKTFRPWIYIIIIIIVILVFMIAYTFWVKVSEEKLEKEIERYSNRPQYEPLEGELAEDYEAAKSNYYDHIGLGNQSGKSLGEVIGNPEDVELDMTGIFDDEPQENSYNEADEGDNLKDLIASLEQRLGSRTDEGYDSDWTRDENDWSDGAPSTDWSDEEPAEIFEAEEEKWDSSEHQIPEEIADEEFTEQDFIEELLAEDTNENEKVLKTLEREAEYEPVTRGPKNVNPEEDVRAYLDTLKEGTIITHKVYGDGKVIDNSDEQIIQVSFGDDMRFLKKDKLAMKNLIKF